jgi:hypothetical protein
MLETMVAINAAEFLTWGLLAELRDRPLRVDEPKNRHVRGRRTVVR